MQPTTATTAEQGGKGGIRTSRVASLGGPVNAGLATFWLVMALVGWVLTMAGLSALQNYINSSTLGGTLPTWWPGANLPALGPGSLLRFSWWSWVWTLITFITFALAWSTAVIPAARIPLVAFATVAALLCMWSGNTMLDVVAQHVSAAHTSAARCAAAGFIISAIAFLCLTYSVGLVHH